MLKHLKFLILLVLPFSLAMALTSCGDDDNENLEDGNEETSLLVGSWEREDVEDPNEVPYEDPQIWTFNSDGTFKFVYWSQNFNIIYTGKYSYDASTGILLITIHDDYDTWTEKYKVLHISKSELWLQEDDGYMYIFTRKIQ